MTTALVLLLGGCASLPPPTASAPRSLHERLAACATDHAAPLLDDALAAAGANRARLGISEADLRSSPYYTDGDLGDPGRSPLLDLMLARPWQAGCLHDAVVSQADEAARSGNAGAAEAEAKAQAGAKDAAAAVEDSALFAWRSTGEGVSA